MFAFFGLLAQNRHNGMLNSLMKCITILRRIVKTSQSLEHIIAKVFETGIQRYPVTKAAELVEQAVQLILILQTAGGNGFPCLLPFATVGIFQTNGCLFERKLFIIKMYRHGTGDRLVFLLFYLNLGEEGNIFFPE